jgi:hypothetical protein
LEVAVALGAAGYPIEARTVTDAVRWLESKLGPTLTAETIEPYLAQAVAAVSTAPPPAGQSRRQSSGRRAP